MSGIPDGYLYFDNQGTGNFNQNSVQVLNGGTTIYINNTATKYDPESFTYDASTSNDYVKKFIYDHYGAPNTSMQAHIYLPGAGAAGMMTTMDSGMEVTVGGLKIYWGGERGLQQSILWSALSQGEKDALANAGAATPISAPLGSVPGVDHVNLFAPLPPPGPPLGSGGSSFGDPFIIPMIQ
jgi:hypothetical protein